MFGSTYNGQFEDVEAVNKMVGACLRLLNRCWRTAIMAGQSSHAVA